MNLAQNIIITSLLIVSLSMFGVICDAQFSKDANHQEENEITDLMNAIDTYDGEKALSKVEDLIAAGVDVNLPNKEGVTALILAVSKGRLDIVERLLAARADTNLQDERGWTALTYTSFSAYPVRLNIVRELLAAGANIDLQDNDEMTTLMYVARFGRLDILRELLAAGADVTIKDKFGMTALRYASFAESRVEKATKEAIQEALIAAELLQQ